MNIINQLLAGANLFRLNFQMCNNNTNSIPQPKEKEEQLNLLQNTIFSNLLMASQMKTVQQSQSQQLQVVQKSKKISKRNNNCGHPEKEHYAKGMCNNCYHKYGRTKKPWICGHDKLYAQGLCQNCYINKYNQKRRELGDTEVLKQEVSHQQQLEEQQS
ncbi:unnamed protein product [Paramecium sonneborni]|uniref:Uncharacterized protein n=1 Tax=Paramecium sonneborni TaxID=65129 RepID=A0A8S1MNY9_9CILI|nr:unnamed protein product [Paramecium sonneborni]